MKIKFGEFIKITFNALEIPNAPEYLEVYKQNGWTINFIESSDSNNDNDVFTFEKTYTLEKVTDTINRNILD